LSKNKFALWFPPSFLSVNILEAVIRDSNASHQWFVDGILTIGGP
jgi:hypothetical protein